MQLEQSMSPLHMAYPSEEPDTGVKLLAHQGFKCVAAITEGSLQLAGACAVRVTA